MCDVVVCRCNRISWSLLKRKGRLRDWKRPTTNVKTKSSITSVRVCLAMESAVELVMNSAPAQSSHAATTADDNSELTLAQRRVLNEANRARAVRATDADATSAPVAGGWNQKLF